jgi:hypothetical protein
MMRLSTIFIIILAVSIAIYYLLTKKENFETPNRETAIGGMKGDCPGCHNGIGFYQEERKAFVKGNPNPLYGKRTIIDPSQIGFSTNSIINRNQYSDFFDSNGNRRDNPNFKFFTRYKGLGLNPSVYSEPEYSFSTL